MRLFNRRSHEPELDEDAKKANAEMDKAVQDAKAQRQEVMKEATRSKKLLEENNFGIQIMRAMAKHH